MNGEKMIMPEDTKGPEAFLDFRAISAKEINTRVCEKFMADGVVDYEAIKEIFGTDPEVVDRIVFVLQSFTKPKDPSKARRKDGSHIATHSLQLFRAAKDFYQIKDEKVGRAVLVHDLIEDTETTSDNIVTTLGQEDAELAGFMTEEDLDEESKAKAGSDVGILSIAKFVHKLKLGGETISKAEILDRMDDISDLGYITKKLSNPEAKEKAVRSLEDKFAKCSFTVQSLIGEDASDELSALRTSFFQLMDLQKQKIETEFGVVIDQDAIDRTKSKYIAYF